MLVILCGLPRSGKSTYASNFNGTILSRDTIREELYGTRNNFDNEELVSCIFNARLDTALNTQDNVLIDNTNLKLKYIEPFLRIANTYNYDIRIVRFFTDTITLYERAKATNFPIKVINNMVSTQELYKFTVDNLKQFTRTNITIEDIITVNHSIEELFELTKFNQNNSFHKDDLNVHCEKVGALAKKEFYKEFLYHDIGKIMSVDKNLGNYKGHEKAGWYIGQCYNLYSEFILLHMDKFKLRNGMKLRNWFKQVYDIYKNEKIKYSNISFDNFIEVLCDLWVADAIVHTDTNIDWLYKIIKEVKSYDYKMFC